MPPKIRQFSRQLLNNPEEVSLSIGKTAEGVTQGAYLVYDSQKEALVRHILTQKDYEAVIIFASTKEKVKNLFKLLKKDFEVEAFHSDLEQVEREKIMSRFKNKSLKILIGTDIISRGIDVVGIELIINYDTPNDPEDYVHRVGRTARADSKGEAITFISDKDKYKFVRIEGLIGMEVEKLPLPEGFEKGPDYRGGGSKSGGTRIGGNKKKPFNKNKKNKRSNFNQSDPTPKKFEEKNISEPKPNLPPRENNPKITTKLPPRENSPKSKTNLPPREKPAEVKTSETKKDKSTPFGKRTNVVDE
jgi:superfamily II DNA/RNA helicase